MVLKSSAATNRSGKSGTPVAGTASPSASSPAAWARATRCGPKFAIRFTAMNWTKTPRRSRRAWDFSSRWTKAISSGAVLAEQKAKGVAKKCVAFKMTEKAAPPRPHYSIWSTGANPAVLGEVVSGTQSPSLQAGIGLGYVPPEIRANLGPRLRSRCEGKIRGPSRAETDSPKRTETLKEDF